MSESERLLTTLEEFFKAMVHLQGAEGEMDELRLKLDVIERAVQVLRLRSGWSDNATTMADLVSARVEPTGGFLGSGALHIVLREAGRPAVGWNAPSERTQSEVQGPLLLFLFHEHRAGRRINAQLVGFLNAVRSCLCPADVESTRTGVTRAMTTTRTAARSLRQHGLLTHSERTAYKTWELSVLGAMVAAVLHQSGMKEEMPPRALPRRDMAGAHGATNHLSEEVEAAVRQLQDPDVTRTTFQRLLAPNVEVFETFAPALDAMMEYWNAFDVAPAAGPRDLANLQTTARAVVRAVSAAVTAAAFTQDLARSVEIEELLRRV